MHYYILFTFFFFKIIIVKWNKIKPLLRCAYVRYFNLCPESLDAKTGQFASLLDVNHFCCRRPTLVSVEWWYLACRVPPQNFGSLKSSRWQIWKKLAFLNNRIFRLKRLQGSKGTMLLVEKILNGAWWIFHRKIANERERERERGGGGWERKRKSFDLRK